VFMKSICNWNNAVIVSVMMVLGGYSATASSTDDEEYRVLQGIIHHLDSDHTRLNDGINRLDTLLRTMETEVGPLEARKKKVAMDAASVKADLIATRDRIAAARGRMLELDMVRQQIQNLEATMAREAEEVKAKESKCLAEPDPQLNKQLEEHFTALTQEKRQKELMYQRLQTEVDELTEQNAKAKQQDGIAAVNAYETLAEMSADLPEEERLKFLKGCRSCREATGFVAQSS
jgi:chromosome segregation ATPase